MSTVDYKAPAGKLLLTTEAPIEEWLAQRLTGVGGTDMATIMGSNSYANVYEAWADKFVESPADDPDNELYYWGHQDEEGTAHWFERRTGLQTRRAGMYHHRENRHHLANPDRFTSDGGVLELKSHESMTTAAKTGLKGDLTDPAYDQLQWYMYVTGRSHGWFAAKIGKKVHVRGPFPRDDAYIARMTAKADVFWESVQTKTAPPLDLATVTDAEIAARFPFADPDSKVEVDDLPVPDMILDDLARLTELKAGAAEIDGEKAKIEARLKATVGDREYLTVHGRPVLRWQQVAGRKTFDKASAVKSLAEHIGKTPVEVEADFTKQGAPTRRLSLIEDKAAA